MPSCFHVLRCVAGVVVFPQVWRGPVIWAVFPRGCGDATVHRQVLIRGLGGGVATLPQQHIFFGGNAPTQHYGNVVLTVRMQCFARVFYVDGCPQCLVISEPSFLRQKPPGFGG